MANIRPIVNLAAALDPQGTDIPGAVRSVLDRLKVRGPAWFALLHEGCMGLRGIRKEKKTLGRRSVQAEQAVGQMPIRFPPASAR